MHSGPSGQALARQSAVARRWEGSAPSPLRCLPCCAVTALHSACAGPFGAFYDFWIERERVARAVGGTLWGIDVRPMYADMDRIVSGAPDDAVLLDAPCGGGVAFRWLRPAQRVRYIAVDLDED